MASESLPRPIWNVSRGCCDVSGERDVFILGSENEAATDPNIVPRCRIILREQDKQRLFNQGILEDIKNDLGIIQTRFSLDKALDMVGVEVSKPGQELSCNYVLKQLEDFLKSCKKPGAVIYYLGNGKRNTGDWCFKDGFINFRHIADLYTSFFRHRVLTIVSDCSHSGSWVKECCLYLDEQGVRPCGHSAAEKGILLKVYASCRPDEIAAAPSFSVHCATNDKNNGSMSYFIFGKELRESQHTYGISFTEVRCGKMIDEPCSVSPELTWQRRNEAKRVYLVRGKDRNRPAWHYVLLFDDEDTIKNFKERVDSGTIDVAKFGQVLKSGWGKDPPNEVRDELEHKYGIIYT